MKKLIRAEEETAARPHFSDATSPIIKVVVRRESPNSHSLQEQLKFRTLWSLSSPESTATILLSLEDIV